ncbi:MAG: N-acetyl-gamma-glutamyl-phosphate reductase [Chloroflexi bacterium]|nr:N-acetyl-gamma-glutamyl-phosphate reductase [Chloroflexota bacterium]
MLRVSIVGVTGYGGGELVRLLGKRADVKLIELVGRSAAGRPLGEVFPSLAPLGLTLSAGDQLERPEEADFVFLALPHHASAEKAAEILENAPQTKVIDLSADFRLRDLATYEAWYGSHPAPYLLKEAVYGLPELYRAKLNSGVRLVANPGCYPTCSSLALAPALKGEAIIEPDVIINALSGTSGAGRELKQNLHYSELNESASAYGLAPAGHRHLPEIRQVLEDQYGGPVEVLFTPHLLPLTRGMLATCYARLTPAFLAEHRDPKSVNAALRERYRDFYKNDPFVMVVDSPPTTKQVQTSNYCFIYPTADLRTGRLVTVAVLDNLVKGAAGEAVQNMNLLAGLPETTGLEMLSVYP